MKNILIGVLMATCMFLMIGATDEVESVEMFVDGQVSVECEASKYQAFSSGTSDALYMINTETGELDKKGLLKKTWKRISPKTDWIKE